MVISSDSLLTAPNLNDSANVFALASAGSGLSKLHINFSVIASFLESKPKENYEPSTPDYVKPGAITGEQVDSIPTENDPFANFGNEVEVLESDLPF